MYIDFNKEKVSILTINDSLEDKTAPDSIQGLFVMLPVSTIFTLEKYYSLQRKLRDSCGIYIGLNSSITNELISKEDSKLDYKNIYVEDVCNIPNIELQRLGVTRKRDLSNADVVITPIPNIDVLEEPYKKYTCVLHNGEEYIIVTHLDSFWRYNQQNLRKIYKNEFNLSPEGEIAKLFDIGVIPKDFKILHLGTVLNIKKKWKKFINNFESYKNIIFENNYLQYINSSKEQLDYEMLETIKVLLRSKNLDDQNIGLQMLYNFDPKNKAYTICNIINQAANMYPYNIKKTSFWNSGKFENFLSLIDVKRSDFPIWDIKIIRNKVYKYCDDDEKQIIINESFKEINCYISSAISRVKSYDFLKEINIEPPKLILNEKDYYHPGKQE